MALADPNDNVIILADGRRIDASGKEIKSKPKMIEIPSNSEAQKLVVRANRRIADLPALPDKMNGISVVLVYSMFGLADQEIAVATGLTVEMIETIRMHDAYQTMLDDLRKNILEADQDRIRRLITQETENSMRRIVELRDSEDDKTALKAAQDIMDRGGYRPADIVEHRVKMEGSLRILHVDKRSTSDIPVIDAKFEKVIENGESN